MSFPVICLKEKFDQGLHYSQSNQQFLDMSPGSSVDSSCFRMSTIKNNLLGLGANSANDKLIGFFFFFFPDFFFFQEKNV